MKNFIRNIVALAAVLTIGTASIPTTNDLPVSLTVSASAASIYSVTDARNDLATVNAHPYYLSYYRKYNTVFHFPHSSSMYIHTAHEGRVRFLRPLL